MKKSYQALVIAGILLNILDAVQAEEKLAYVFEVVRHGARAPLMDEPEGYFKVGKGILTAVGMRQRLLLGKLNRQRYIDQYQLLDQTYNPNQLFIESTNVLRTIQSSYAELMGLYPPSPQKQSSLTQGEHDSITSGKGLPKLQLRNHIQKHLNNLHGTIDGYTMIPSFNYYQLTVNDDIDQNDCPYAKDAFTYYLNTPSVFSYEGNYVIPTMREKIGKAFNLTQSQVQNLDFGTFYYYCDILMAENAEGDSKRSYFNNEEWFYIRNSQKTLLSKGFDSVSRPLYATKFFSKPLKAMDAIVQAIFNGQDTTDMLRYFIYSAHDTQIIAVLDWLQPYNHEYIDATYTSTIYFELFYDFDCLKQNPKSNSCFTIRLTHNGTPFKLQTCVQANQQRNSASIICRYDDFLTHIQKNSYKDDFNQGCLKPFVKPTNL
eukprot:403359272